MILRHTAAQPFRNLIQKQILLILFTTLSVSSNFAQETDSVPPQKTYGPVINRFSVGTNFIQTGTGTLNVLVNYKYLHFSEIQIGLGYIPFRRYFDAVNFVDTGHPIVDTAFTNGYYLNAGFNWITQSQINGILNCISIDWRKWYFLGDNNNLYTKARYSFSFGKRIQLNPLLSIEGSIGPTLVRFNNAVGWNDEYFAADFGLVVNFHLQGNK